jgi:hypothetical protein
MSAARLLDRLEGVKSTGQGRWLARCPAHEDRSPSLSIRELGDGRLLLHDFAGCSAGDVLEALGLSLADLYPDGPRGSFRPSHSRVPAGDVLQAIAHEVDVAALILAGVVDRRAIQAGEFERLALAASRIGGAAHGRH